jgi:anti-sigma factor RsiW
MSEHQHTPQCRQLLGNLSDYIDGELQAKLCAEIEEHLKGCEDCTVVLNTMRRTIELYRKASTEQSPEMPGEMRQRLFATLHLEDYLKEEH